MAISKVERLMNLVICLLSTRQYLSAEQIRKSVAGYEDSSTAEAFARKFERDKNELRDLGIPLETGRASGLADVDGYRIHRDAYELPDIQLDSDEATAVTLATALWESPEFTSATHSAMIKLKAAGVSVDPSSADAIHLRSPRHIGSERAIAMLLTAIDSGQAVRFDHRAGVGQPATSRIVEPWGVVTVDGKWYLVGHDRDRDQTRTFRISRIVSTPVVIGAPGAVHRPEVDVADIVRSAVRQSDSDGHAKVWLRNGAADGLRRLSTGSTPSDHCGDSGTIVDIEIRSADGLVRQLVSAGPDAVVIEPADIRDRVVAMHRAVVAGSVVGR